MDSTAGRLQDVANRTTEQLVAVGANARQAVDKSLSDQPYPSLPAAATIGFVVGAIWKS